MSDGQVIGSVNGEVLHPGFPAGDELDAFEALEARIAAHVPRHMQGLVLAAIVQTCPMEGDFVPAADSLSDPLTDVKVLHQL